MPGRKSWINSNLISKSDLRLLRNTLFQPDLSMDRFWESAKVIVPHLYKFINEVSESKNISRDWVLAELFGQSAVCIRRATIQTNSVGNYCCKSKRVTIVAGEYV